MQVNLWGLDAIKTKGESVAIVLHLLGARPLSEGTGRQAKKIATLLPAWPLDAPPIFRGRRLQSFQHLHARTWQSATYLAAT